MPPNLRWIILLALIVRSAVFAAAYFSLHNLQAVYAKDTWSYLQPAIELIRFGTLSTHQQPELFRPPGYPLLLTLGVLTGQIEVVTIALQILLSALTTYLVYRIAEEIFHDTKIAISSAFIFSIEPLSVISSCWLLSETLYVTLLALAILFLLRFVRLQQSKSLILAAVFLACAVYVRPIGYWLALLIAVAISAWGLFFHNKQAVKLALVFLVVTFSLLGLWQVRNYRQTGYSGFSVAMSYNLYFHQTAALEAHRQQRSFYDVLDEMGFYDPDKYLQAHPEQQNWSAAERYDFMQREGLRTVGQAPILALQIYLRGLVISLLDPGATEYLRLFQAYPRSGKLLNTMVSEGIIAVGYKTVTQHPALVVLSVLFGAFLIATYVVSLIGLKAQRLSLTPVLLILIGSYHLLLAGGTLASARFRMPMMLMVCIFAGAGILKISNYIRLKFLHSSSPSNS